MLRFKILFESSNDHIRFSDVLLKDLWMVIFWPKRCTIISQVIIVITFPRVNHLLCKGIFKVLSSINFQAPLITLVDISKPSGKDFVDIKLLEPTVNGLLDSGHLVPWGAEGSWLRGVHSRVTDKSSPLIVASFSQTRDLFYTIVTILFKFFLYSKFTNINY